MAGAGGCDVSGEEHARGGRAHHGASDTPVTPYVVLDEIEIGVTRNSPFEGEEDTDMMRWPEQGLTAYQMLEIYTKNSAYQNFMEDMVGTIEPGKKADIVVLDQNILDVEPTKINEARCSTPCPTAALSTKARSVVGLVHNAVQ